MHVAGALTCCAVSARYQLRDKPFMTGKQSGIQQAVKHGKLHSSDGLCVGAVTHALCFQISWRPGVINFARIPLMATSSINSKLSFPAAFLRDYRSAHPRYGDKSSWHLIGAPAGDGHCCAAPENQQC